MPQAQSVNSAFISISYLISKALSEFVSRGRVTLGFLGQLGSGYLSTGVQSSGIRNWNIPVWTLDTNAISFSFHLHTKSFTLPVMNQTCHRTVEPPHKVKGTYSHVNFPAHLWPQSPRNGSFLLALSSPAVLSEINSAQQWRHRTGRLSNVRPEPSAHLDLQSFNSLSVQLLFLLHFTPQISFSFIRFVLSDKNKRTLFQKKV